MTFWESEHWRKYERAYGSPVSRVDELAAATWQTHVVDLTPPEEVLWKNIPKTMRQAIQNAQRLYHVSEFTESFFGTFRHLHVKANGGVEPRPTCTYDVQREWLRFGCARLFVGSHRDTNIHMGAVL